MNKFRDLVVDWEGKRIVVNLVDGADDGDLIELMSFPGGDPDDDKFDIACSNDELVSFIYEFNLLPDYNKKHASEYLTWLLDNARPKMGPDVDMHVRMSTMLAVAKEFESLLTSSSTQPLPKICSGRKIEKYVDEAMELLRGFRDIFNQKI